MEHWPPSQQVVPHHVNSISSQTPLYFRPSPESRDPFSHFASTLSSNLPSWNQLTSLFNPGSLNSSSSHRIKFVVTPELREVAKNILVRRHKNGYKCLCWNLLHGIALQFPDTLSEQKEKAFKSLLYSIAETFPCDVCGDHLKEYLAVNPVRCKTRDEATRYLYELHNFVNIRVGLPVLSFDDAMKIQKENADIDWTAAERLLKDIARATPTPNAPSAPVDNSLRTPPLVSGLTPAEITSVPGKIGPETVSFRFKSPDSHVHGGEAHDETRTEIQGRWGENVFPMLLILGGFTLFAVWAGKRFFASRNEKASPARSTPTSNSTPTLLSTAPTSLSQAPILQYSDPSQGDWHRRMQYYGAV